VAGAGFGPLDGASFLSSASGWRVVSEAGSSFAEPSVELRISGSLSGSDVEPADGSDSSVLFVDVDVVVGMSASGEAVAALVVVAEGNGDAPGLASMGPQAVRATASKVSAVPRAPWRGQARVSTRWWLMSRRACVKDLGSAIIEILLPVKELGQVALTHRKGVLMPRTGPVAG
jgi:hypothetical protein